MRHIPHTLLLALALTATLTSAAGADPGGPPAPRARPAQLTVPGVPVTPKLVVDRPEPKTLIREGPVGRLLLAGTWYFRPDDSGDGTSLGFQRQRSLSGWQAITIPHNWNAKDVTLNRASRGWYRRVLVLP